jgi:ABC-type amino acid transport substrate-binding protein
MLNTIIVVLVVVFSLPSVQANDMLAFNKESVNEIQEIIKRGKLVVAMYSKDSPPFYYVDKYNQLTGLDVVLIKGFAELLGVPVEFDRSSKFLNDTVDLVENHKADLAITKLSMTFKRATRVLFTEPYVNLHQSLLINRLELLKQLNGRSQEETIQQLSGKIGVVAKSSYVDYAKHFKGMEVVTYSTWPEVISAVQEGKITAAFCDEAEIKIILRDQSEMALALLSVVLKDTNDLKGIAVAMDHNNLKIILNFYIKSLNMDITADKVVNNYVGVIKEIEQKINAQEH